MKKILVKGVSALVLAALITATADGGNVGKKSPYSLIDSFNKIQEAEASGFFGNVIRSDEYDEKIEAARKRKEALEAKKKKQAEENAKLEKQKANTENYIAELDNQIAALQLELFEIGNEIVDMNAAIEVTKQEIVDAKAEEEKQYAAMKRRIKYIYENGDVSIIEIILTSDSISDLLNEMEYSRKITEYDNELLDKYIEAKETVIEKKRIQEGQLEELEAAKAQCEYNEEQLQILMAAKSDELKKLVADIGVGEDLLEEYGDEILNEDINIEKLKKDQQAAIEAERKRLEEEERKRKEAEAARSRARQSTVVRSGNNAAGITTSDSTDPSNMLWPLPGDSDLCCPFGPRIAPLAGASTYHQGVDIGGYTGEQIVAALAGTVSGAGYSSSRGNYVEINHGNGYVTRYMHCSKLYVSAGQYVKRGEVIALVGSTGVSTAPHLHFSVVVNGVNVDPEKYIHY